MHCIYNTKGSCARTIEFDINNDIVTNIKFTGGCPGNLQMLSKIMNGWHKDKIINTCKGNLCGIKTTSCADQLSKALETIEEKEK
ncbi:MAG: TIGR03905 family TSCPD domain-containing protein [Bacilli bacterium]|nr:TIGR03905 family TSCPD domain-containing protein [Bacilli bacterium]